MKLATALTVLLATAVVANPVAEAEPGVTAAPELNEIREAFEDVAPSSCPAKVCVSQARKVNKCATSCINSAAKKNGCSNKTDFSCECGKSSAIAAAAQNCVISACGVATAISVQSQVSSVCKCNSAHHYTTC